MDNVSEKSFESIQLNNKKFIKEPVMQPIQEKPEEERKQAKFPAKNKIAEAADILYEKHCKELKS